MGRKRIRCRGRHLCRATTIQRQVSRCNIRYSCTTGKERRSVRGLA